MTTIGQLPQAASAYDTDQIPVSQNGLTVSLTRAQMLAGVQPQLIAPQGSLFGRSSAGLGGAETVAIGDNLAVVDGVLSAIPAAFNAASLPPSLAATDTDLVPLAQTVGGISQMTAMPYAHFLQGIAGVAGVSASAMMAQAQGSTASRSLAAILADGVAIEAFGAVGDGMTDDSAAFALALAANVPLRLGPKTYVVQGQFNVSGTNVVLIGTPGQTRVTRTVQNGNGAWLEITSSQIFAYGVIFDANRFGVTQDSWAVLVAGSCEQAVFEHCRFTGAAGATMGCGLTVLASFPAVTRHSVLNCEADNNAIHGIWIQAVVGAMVNGCRAHDNGTYGIVIDYADPMLVQKLTRCSVYGNAAWGNQRGISVGNFNATNTTPPIWGNANPDAIAILVEQNLCHDNSSYGLYASGSGLVLDGNLCINNVAAGITARLMFPIASFVAIWFLVLAITELIVAVQYIAI